MSHDWDEINGHVGRPKIEKNKKRSSYLTIRTNRQDEDLLYALKRRTGMSNGEILRQGLYCMAVRWKIDPSEYVNLDG